MMRLNSFEGKRLLAFARGGDYAHAAKLIQECGIEIWEDAANFYDTMHETLQTGSMGGAIVYARRMARRDGD